MIKPTDHQRRSHRDLLKSRKGVKCDQWRFKSSTQHSRHTDNKYPKSAALRLSCDQCEALPLDKVPALHKSSGLVGVPWGPQRRHVHDSCRPKKAESAHLRSLQLQSLRLDSGVLSLDNQAVFLLRRRALRHSAHELTLRLQRSTVHTRRSFYASQQETSFFLTICTRVRNTVHANWHHKKESNYEVVFVALLAERERLLITINLTNCSALAIHTASAASLEPKGKYPDA